MLPLEEWLEYRCRGTTEHKTADGITYFDAYHVQKEKLKTHVYHYISNGIATFRPDAGTGNSFEIYTNHGLAHVEDLIKVIGLFLGCSSPTAQLSLNEFEVFLLMMAALSHDAGNIYGRENHNRRVVPLLMQPSLKTISRLEISEVGAIAQAHTGKGLISGRESKDTLSELQERKVLGYTKIFNPRRLAAILRFCDEICEDNTRTPEILVSHPNVSAGPSSRFLHYGLSISSVDVDHTAGCIKIFYDVSEQDATKKIHSKNYSGVDDNYYLVDEILKRIKKIKIEMDYCFQFLQESKIYKEVTASIRSTYIDEFECVHYQNRALINLSQKGYPNHDDSFSKVINDYSGFKIKKVVRQEKAARRVP